MINETLKYASLFGTSFYYHDLKQILQQSEGVIRNLIKKAQNFCLVNGNINGASLFMKSFGKLTKMKLKKIRLNII